MHKFSIDTFYTLSLLTPYDINLPKERVGNQRDGAYVIVDQPVHNDILSFGIDNDTSFEEAMASRGHRIFMYDHTIDKLPTENPKFNFHRLGICGRDDPAPDLRTMDQHIEAIPDLSDRLSLKIDVEGEEWEVFSTLSPETLARFDHIFVELHWFRNLDVAESASKILKSLELITKQFTLYHVHANNCAPVLMVNGFTVADVIEVSFVRTTLVDRLPSSTIYPSIENRANRADFFDHPLLFFPFLPSSSDTTQIEAMLTRIMLDYVPTSHV